MYTEVVIELDAPHLFVDRGILMMNRTGNAIRMAVMRLKFAATDSIHNFRWAVRHVFMFTARLPIEVLRFITHEFLGLLLQMLSSLVIMTDLVNKALKYMLHAIFIAPIARLRPFTSSQCCNEVVARSRPQGNDIYFRYLLLIGTYRCRFCATRSRRFWPTVEPKIREYESKQRQSTESAGTNPPESTPQGS